MKRRILKLTLFLLAGAIINAAVAFSSALYGGPGVRDHFLTRQFTDAEFQELAAFSCLPGGQMTTGARRAVGWPFPSFDGWMNLPAGTPAFPVSNYRWQATNGILVGNPFSPTLIPTSPRWSGFVLNVLFYGAVLRLLLPLPATVRCHIRRERGQCTACGYSLRENVSEKCPECGADVRREFLKIPETRG